MVQTRVVEIGIVQFGHAILRSTLVSDVIILVQPEVVNYRIVDICRNTRYDPGHPA